MAKKLLMGNQAVAYGALSAGVNLVAAYPGTPSTEVLETVASFVRQLVPPSDTPSSLSALPHVEWSVNEKAALEVAAGCAFSGGRALVCMKQVGLNVAADPLMTLAYLGVLGGLVLYVTDDPGPISSQTEQDTRQFAQFAHVAVLDPSTPEEAYQLVQEAFALSERHQTPVILRCTTRICHGSALIEVPDSYQAQVIPGFVRDSKWVTFPPLAYRAHAAMPAKLAAIAAEFESKEGAFAQTTYVQDYFFKRIEQGAAKKSPTWGIVASGISWGYLCDALDSLGAQDCLPDLRLFKVGTPFPFPDETAVAFLQGLQQVLLFEELEPVIERELLRVAGARQLSVRICGKLTADTQVAGENSIAGITKQLVAWLGCEPQGNVLPKMQDSSSQALLPELPEVAVRPPVLCAGCPHRGSFVAVKQALRGQPATFSGDIGCYTLGNALPLDMVDTCICMGAGFTVPQGMYWADSSTTRIGFVGDSTFFASGITGVVNAVYNQVPITLIVLDNSVTAMTGGQHHPGTGIRAGWEANEADARNAISIPQVLRALGVGLVLEQDPLKLEEAILAVQQAVEYPSVSAVVFKSPCVNLVPPAAQPEVQSAQCTFCKKCINTLGCPALITANDYIDIDRSLCYGCDLCVSVCPFSALTSRHKRAVTL